MVRGSLVWVTLDPARGAEVPKTRPCIVVSRTEANDVSSTVTIVPLSSVNGRAPDRMVQPLFSAKETLLPKDSRALCDQVRTVDRRRIRDTVGVLSPELLELYRQRRLRALVVEDQSVGPFAPAVVQ